MPTYRVTDPQSGLQLQLTGESPPTEQELSQLFASKLQETYQSDVPTMGAYGIIKRPPQPGPGLLEQAKGIGETGLTAVTGATGGLLGQLYGTGKGIGQEIMSGQFGTAPSADRVEQEALKYAGELTYQPRTQTGQEYTQKLGTIAGQYLQPLTGLTGQLQAIGIAARESSPAMMELKNRALKKPEVYGKGVGAEEVPQAITRQETAKSLPVPVELTKGAVTRTAEDLTFEKEMMKNPQLGAPLRKRAEENNLQALQNFDELIDQTGAQAYDISQTGNKVINSLSQGYKAAKNETRTAYTRAKNSPGAKEPVDTNIPVVVGTADEPITGTLWSYMNSKPRGVESTRVVDSARATAVKLGIATEDENGNLIPNPTNVSQMEGFRRELSGMAGYGDKTGLRDETIMKSIIDKTTEGKGGDLYKKARQLRTQQARKYENRAVVARLINNIRGMDDPKVSADMVFNKSIVNSSPEEIRFLRRVMQTSGKDGKQAWNELQGATIRHIQDQSTKGMGMDSQDHPIVSPAKLHNTVTALDSNGRLDIILGKARADIVRDLNDVVRYVNTVPPGTLINNSGTAGMILAAITEAGTYGATMGIPVPVITALKLLRDQVKEKKIKAKINRALKGLKEQQ